MARNNNVTPSSPTTDRRGRPAATACIVTHHRALNATARPSACTPPRPDHRPSDALQPDHRPEVPSGRTVTACIVIHHRDLRCPSPTTGRLTPSSPTTGRRGQSPSAWPAQRMSPAQPPAKPDHRQGRPPAQQKIRISFMRVKLLNRYAGHTDTTYMDKMLYSLSGHLCRGNADSEEEGNSESLSLLTDIRDIFANSWTSSLGTTPRSSMASL
ncbi:hypothetical protein Bbelb_355210 [Branchiostoma belcheri]|nr:hypothetical protein Bbelb_355210 [Branchiostoma belcheri]